MTLRIQRPDGTFIGVPPLETRITAGDRLTLYGRTDALDGLDQRRETYARIASRDAADDSTTR